MQKLKPCPFCGGKAKIIHYISRTNIKNKIYIGYCCACELWHGHSKTKTEAINKWNSRVSEHNNNADAIGFMSTMESMYNVKFVDAKKGE